MGIKKKIVVGFLLIGLLLLISGILTSVELVNLNRDTASKIKNNEEILSLSKQLLDIAQQSNTAILNSINSTLDVYDSIIISNDEDFDKLLLKLQSKSQSLEYIQRIEVAYSRYKDVMISRTKDKNVSFDWFVDVYSASYSRLSSCIKDYMMYEQDKFLKYTSVLEENMYRAFMIGIIAFASSFFLLFTFYLMIRIFFISPVLKIEKSLHDFLKANIHYSVKIETEDEMKLLSSDISELCSRVKTPTE